MIGGTDIILVLPEPRSSTYLTSVIGSIIRKVWPKFVFEPDSEKGSSDIFFFKNQYFSDSWDKDGWTEENDCSMVYVLYGRREPTKDITIVVGNRIDNDTGRIIELVKETLGAMEQNGNEDSESRNQDNSSGANEY